MISPILTGIYIKVSRLTRFKEHLVSSFISYFFFTHVVAFCVGRYRTLTGISNNFDIFIIGLVFINAIENQKRKIKSLFHLQGGDRK